ncbi:hypothetical protein D3C84_1051760 [compost metagenome]
MAIPNLVHFVEIRFACTARDGCRITAVRISDGIIIVETAVGSPTDILNAGKRIVRTSAVQKNLARPLQLDAAA